MGFYPILWTRLNAGSLKTQDRLTLFRFAFQGARRDDTQPGAKKPPDCSLEMTEYLQFPVMSGQDIKTARPDLEPTIPGERLTAQKVALMACVNAKVADLPKRSRAMGFPKSIPRRGGARNTALF